MPLVKDKDTCSRRCANLFVDHDGDGFEETAQVSVATDVTDPEELYIYFTGTKGQILQRFVLLKVLRLQKGLQRLNFHVT